MLDFVHQPYLRSGSTLGLHVKKPCEGWRVARLGTFEIFLE